VLCSNSKTNANNVPRERVMKSTKKTRSDSAAADGISTGIGICGALLSASFLMAMLGLIFFFGDVCNESIIANIIDKRDAAKDGGADAMEVRWYDTLSGVYVSAQCISPGDGYTRATCIRREEEEGEARSAVVTSMSPGYYHHAALAPSPPPSVNLQACYSVFRPHELLFDWQHNSMLVSTSIIALIMTGSAALLLSALSAVLVKSLFRILSTKREILTKTSSTGYVGPITRAKARQLRLRM